MLCQIDRKLYLITLTPSTEADFHEGRAKKYTENNFKKYLQNYIKYIIVYELTKLTISIIIYLQVYRLLYFELGINLSNNFN